MTRQASKGATEIDNVTSMKLNRKRFSVSVGPKASSDREYWQTRTPSERLEALEALRQLNYGYDPATARLERVLEVVEGTSG